MIRIFSEFLLFSFWWKDIKAIYVEETVGKIKFKDSSYFHFTKCIILSS
jgi:hypothetical protein